MKIWNTGTMQDDKPLGVPPSEFHPERPTAPFKKRGNLKNAILIAILIVILDFLIYFFLIRPDDSQLLKAIEPLQPEEATIVPTQNITPIIQKPSQAFSKMSALAKEDLAKRLGISPKDIEVVSEEPMTWNDGSLGCPQPGMMYTQAIVEGSKIVLAAKQKNYNYHAGNAGTPTLCEQETK